MHPAEPRSRGASLPVVLSLCALASCRFDASGIVGTDGRVAPDRQLVLVDSGSDRGPLDGQLRRDGAPAADISPDAPPPPSDTDGDTILDIDDPCPNTANTLLLDDDFDASTGWLAYSGAWAVDNGDLLQSSIGTTCYAQHAYRPSLSLADVYIEASVTKVTGATGSDCNLLGVAVRSKLPSYKTFQLCGVNLHACNTSCVQFPVGVFGLGWNGSALPAGPQSKSTSAVTASLSGPYAIRMAIRGNQVRCWLSADKSTELTWSADNLSPGTVGLYALTTTARFHRVRLFEIPPSCN